MKRKFITQEEYETIISNNWTPIILEKEQRPSAINGLPEDITLCCIGSGSAETSNPHDDNSLYIENQIGGLDVCRYGEDGVLIDKEWYRIIDDPDAPDLPEGYRYILIGPINIEEDHHLFEVPKKYDDAILTNSSGIKIEPK
jgi:hypothetical protein